MNEHSLVSIIMPLYNSAAFVRESIFSILNQTYQNFEILVVDDCSSDESREIINSIGDERIHLFLFPSHEGAAAARNLAISKAKGDFVAFLDSDDLWDPTKLERQLRFMHDNQHGFTCTFARGIKENVVQYIEKCPDIIERNDLIKCDYISCLTVIIKKELLTGVSVLPDIKKRNDYALWLQVIEKEKCYCFPEVLASYRIREKSLSHQNKFSLLKAHYILWAKQFSKNFIFAWFYAFRNAFYTQLIKKRKFRIRVSKE